MKKSYLLLKRAVFTVGCIASLSLSSFAQTEVYNLKVNPIEGDWKVLIDLPHTFFISDYQHGNQRIMTQFWNPSGSNPLSDNLVLKPTGGGGVSDYTGLRLSRGRGFELGNGTFTKTYFKVAKESGVVFIGNTEQTLLETDDILNISNGDVHLRSDDGQDNDADFYISGDYGRNLDMWINDDASDNSAYIQAYSENTKLVLGAGGWKQQLYVLPTNQIGIGTDYVPSDFMLGVNGSIICEELRVKLRGTWGDFVFADDYQLMPLNELATYVEENKHLPEIPAAAQLEEDGVDLSDMVAKQMVKIEELTLYILEMQKQLDELKASN